MRSHIACLHKGQNCIRIHGVVVVDDDDDTALKFYIF